MVKLCSDMWKLGKVALKCTMLEYSLYEDAFGCFKLRKVKLICIKLHFKSGTKLLNIHSNFKQTVVFIFTINDISYQTC